MNRYFQHEQALQEERLALLRSAFGPAAGEKQQLARYLESEAALFRQGYNDAAELPYRRVPGCVFRPAVRS